MKSRIEWEGGRRKGGKCFGALMGTAGEAESQEGGD